MNTNTKTLIYLVVLAVFDLVIPIPITAGILIYVFLVKPPWFRDLVSEIYAS
jgi:hypothetical protein